MKTTNLGRGAVLRYGVPADDLAKITAAANSEQHVVVILRRVKAGWSIDDAIAAPYYGT